MIKDIQTVQKQIETNLLALQPVVEKTALELAESKPELMTRYLTDYCVSQGELMVSRWRELGEHLISKYNDGYIKDEKGKPQEKGYSESWLKEVINARPYHFFLPKIQKD